MQKELVYLGFFISIEGFRMDLNKVKVILEWPKLKNATKLRSFNGLSNFYRKFIRDFS